MSGPENTTKSPSRRPHRIDEDSWTKAPGPAVERNAEETRHAVDKRGHGDRFARRASRPERPAELERFAHHPGVRAVGIPHVQHRLSAA